MFSGGVRVSEKSNRTSLSRLVRDSAMPMFSGLMSRWTTALS